MTGGAIMVGGLLAAIAVAAAVAAARLRVPALLLFLGIGVAAGSGGAGWLSLSNYVTAQHVGTIALALILFEGGLSTAVHEIRPVLRTAISMATIGTAGTALVTGVAAAALLNTPLIDGLLLGAVLSSTDSAAVFALLRGSTLRRRLARTLEAEAGLNDPVAVILVTGFIAWRSQPGYGAIDMAALLVREMAVGAACGGLVAVVAARLLSRARLPSAGLYPVASFSAGAIAYGGALALDGSGFLAVYLVGLGLASARLPARQTIATFHDGTAWVSQVVLFLVLGLLITPAQLGAVATEGTVIALVLVVLARPLATIFATAGSGYSAAERIVLSWAGLRGAVPVVLATFPVTAHVPGSTRLFGIAFFVVVISTGVQGPTFEPLARRFGLTTRTPPLPRPLTEAGVIQSLGAEVLEVTLGAHDAIVGGRVRDLDLPRSALVTVIVRGDEAHPPRGSTRLRAGDVLHILVRAQDARALPELVERWRHGAPEPPAPPEGDDARLVVVPWRGDIGDATHPSTVRGRRVLERVLVRSGTPGALVRLEDGLVAVTGPTMAMGDDARIRTYARLRLQTAEDDAERRWWNGVADAVTPIRPPGRGR
jgi:cell volume regulation protein A